MARWPRQSSRPYSGRSALRARRRRRARRPAMGVVRGQKSAEGIVAGKPLRQGPNWSRVPQPRRPNRRRRGRRAEPTSLGRRLGSMEGLRTICWNPQTQRGLASLGHSDGPGPCHSTGHRAGAHALVRPALQHAHLRVQGRHVGSAGPGTGETRSALCALRRRFPDPGLGSATPIERCWSWISGFDDGSGCATGNSGNDRAPDGVICSLWASARPRCTWRAGVGGATGG